MHARVSRSLATLDAFGPRRARCSCLHTNSQSSLNFRGLLPRNSSSAPPETRPASGHAPPAGPAPSPKEQLPTIDAASDSQPTSSITDVRSDALVQQERSEHHGKLENSTGASPRNLYPWVKYPGGTSPSGAYDAYNDERPPFSLWVPRRRTLPKPVLEGSQTEKPKPLYDFISEILGSAQPGYPAPGNLLDMSGPASSPAQEKISKWRKARYIPAPIQETDLPRTILTDEQVAAYLQPLYLRGWYVSHKVHTRRPDCLYLAKTSAFTTQKAASEFADKLTELCLKEARTTHYYITEDYLTVSFTTITKDATRPDRENLPRPKRRLDGITMHDVRLAILAEVCWDYYWRHKKILPRGPPDPAVRVLRTIGSLLNYTVPTANSRLEAEIECALCEGPHLLRDCPHRKTTRPRVPCIVCGDREHWFFDCTSPIVKENYVWKECTYCGGAHSTSECKRLRSRQVRAQTRVLPRSLKVF